MNNEQTRSDFEEHFKNLNLESEPDAFGRVRYFHPYVEGVWRGWQAATRKATAAQAKLCQNESMKPHQCNNRHQCWEPCGELGHSAEHARVSERNFCERCGKRLGDVDGIHTCTPPWEKFCDTHCVWTNHHPDCKLADKPAIQGGNDD